MNSISSKSIRAIKPLSFQQHDTDTIGLTYVYPVISRRAQGISIGLNLNPNHLCNWQCVYCQVPDLGLGSSPEINLVQFKQELTQVIEEILHGNFIQHNVKDINLAHLRDIAFSGDGESTTSKQLPEIMNIVDDILIQFDLKHKIKVVLITNGSQIEKQHVQDGLKILSQMNGEVWFKLDSAVNTTRRLINQTTQSAEKALDNFVLCSSLCKSYIQTCLFDWYKLPPNDTELFAYLNWLELAMSRNAKIEGVLLYGVNRKSYSNESEHLFLVNQTTIEHWINKIKQLGVNANYY